MRIPAVRAASLTSLSWLLLAGCHVDTPVGVPDEPGAYVVYDAAAQRLQPGFDLLIDSSEGETRWVWPLSGALALEYPDDQQWGLLAIVVANPEGSDFSGFEAFELPLRAEHDDQLIELGLKDARGVEVRRPLVVDSTLRTYRFPLAEFAPVDTRSLGVVAEIILTGEQAHTLYVGSLSYLPPAPP